MANYAVIKDNKVINVILADSKEIAEEITELTCIEYTDDNPVGISYILDETGKFNPPAETTDLDDLPV